MNIPRLGPSLFFSGRKGKLLTPDRIELDLPREPGRKAFERLIGIGKPVTPLGAEVLQTHQSFPILPKGIQSIIAHITGKEAHFEEEEEDLCGDLRRPICVDHYPALKGQFPEKMVLPAHQLLDLLSMEIRKRHEEAKTLTGEAADIAEDGISALQDIVSHILSKDD